MDREHLALMVQERAEKWAKRPALRYKDLITQSWKEFSWSELEERARAIALGLVELGVQEGEAVAIFSANSPAWTIADFGAQFARAVSVPEINRTGLCCGSVTTSRSRMISACRANRTFSSRPLKSPRS